MQITDKDMRTKIEVQAFRHPKTKVTHLTAVGGYDATLCGESFDGLSEEDGICFETVKTRNITCPNCIKTVEVIKSLI